MTLVPGHIYGLIEDGPSATRVSINHYDPSINHAYTYHSNTGNTFFFAAAMDPIDTWPIFINNKYVAFYSNGCTRNFKGDIYVADGSFLWSTDTVSNARHSMILKMNGKTQVWSILYNFGDNTLHAQNQVGDIVFDRSGNIYACVGVDNTFQATPQLKLMKINKHGVVQWSDDLLSYDNGAEGVCIDNNGIFYYLDYGDPADVADSRFQRIRRYDTVNRVQLTTLEYMRSVHDADTVPFPFFFTEEEGQQLLILRDKSILISVATSGSVPNGRIYESGIIWHSGSQAIYESGHINDESFIASESNPGLPASQHAYGYQDEGMCIDGDDDSVWIQSAVDAFMYKFNTRTRSLLLRRTMLSSTGFPQTFVHFTIAKRFGMQPVSTVVGAN